MGSGKWEVTGIGNGPRPPCQWEVVKIDKSGSGKWEVGSGQWAVGRQWEVGRNIGIKIF